MLDSTITANRVEELLDELRSGRQEARGELLQAACGRLTAITRKLKRSFPQVGRWEQTEDVLQNASMRLYLAMADVEINDSLHFFRLAALQIRRELLDMARRYDGPHGIGRNHFTQRINTDEDTKPPAFEGVENTYDPAAIAQWAEFHEAIEQLPEEQREITELLWYNGMDHADAAASSS